MHDFHPPISGSGLCWVVAAPERGLSISADGNTITLEMRDVAVVDQPRWPALDSIATPARMRFKMEAEVEVPSIGFSWKSDPLATSKSDFAVIGDEVNGRYYDM